MVEQIYGGYCLFGYAINLYFYLKAMVNLSENDVNMKYMQINS